MVPDLTRWLRVRARYLPCCSATCVLGACSEWGVGVRGQCRTRGVGSGVHVVESGGGGEGVEVLVR